jgi:hypothetical protein
MEQAPAGHVPNPYAAVAAAGSQPPAAGAARREGRHRCYAAAVACQDAAAAAVDGVPQPHRSVAAGGGDEAAGITVEHVHCRYPVAVALQTERDAVWSSTTCVHADAASYGVTVQLFHQVLFGQNTGVHGWMDWCVGPANERTMAVPRIYRSCDERQITGREAEERLKDRQTTLVGVETGKAGGNGGEAALRLDAV